MASDKFEFSDVNNSQTNLTMVPGRKNGGCYVSGVMGFILVLLAVLVAVGVGIIVHFAGGDRDVVCQCDALESGSASAVIEECKKMAESGSTDVCSKCPSSGMTPKPGTDMPPMTTPPTTTPPKVIDVRLPDTVIPIHYDIELQPYMHHPDPADFTFKGSVRILVKCLKATDRVTLHVNILEVDRSSIRFYPETPQGSTDPQYDTWEVDPDRQFFIVKLTKNMQVNRQYYVEMNYTAPLTNDLNGLYYSQYMRGNQTIYLAGTQFQPTDARKAFPCFDEPAIKATFNVTLVRPSDRTSISNMPIIDSSQTFVEDGITYVKDVYAQSPKMSTYLLAFVVSDFKYTTDKTKYNVTYRAWATPETVNQTQYALQVGVDVLTHYEDFFEIRFPLPKQDMIAIPDFAAGAMENWGLIIYRETAMLYEPGVSAESNKERVAIVVAHELAHQWFGDLVTPSWWDDLWLNEGFATFVEYMGVDFVHPEWNMFDKFAISEIQDAFEFDGLISSHPLYVPVGHPDEINEIFDSISYAKGASVIRMMRHFLGFDTFKKGLTRYLNGKAYDAAFHDDLWAALTEQSKIEGKNIDVKDVMDTWILQMNYPVVTVTRDFNDANMLHVSQERYLSDPSASDPSKYESPYNYHWTIPLTFTSSKNPNFNQTDMDVHWMYKSETYKTLNVGAAKLPDQSDANGWIIANVEMNGYYRVNYQTGNWLALSNQLKTNHQVIPIINRAQIINDAWNLVKAGHISLEIALKTIDYLDQERDYVPWYAARNELLYVRDMLHFHSLYGRFEEFMQDKLNSTYHYFGLDNTGAGHVDSLARSLVAGEACRYGIQACRDAASAQYRQWMNNPSVNPIDPNLKNVVYCNAIRNGGWDEWSFGLRMYHEVNVATEKALMLSALSCSQKPWILNHYLDLVIQDNSPIRKQDALTVIGYVALSNIGQSLAWNFFRGNYEGLKDQFGSSFFAWTRLIGYMSDSFNTPFQLQEFSDFRKSKEGNLGSGERAFDQGVEKINSNIKWMETNVPIIETWLQDQGY